MMPDQAGDQVLMNQVVQAVLSGKCTLFLGAGVHAGPPDDGPYAGCYPEALQPPIGSGLAKALATGSKLQERYPESADWDLARVAQEHELFLKRPALEKNVRAAVDTGKEPSPVLRALAELDFPIVVTTNYDHLFERALHAAGKEPEIRVYQRGQQVQHFATMTPEGTDSPWLFKIHGDANMPGSMVLTDEDYIDFLMAMSGYGKRPVPDPLGYTLVRNPTLFLGYSLLDYNLRLLFRTIRLGFDPSEPPTMYSVDFHPDPLITQVWSAYVTFIAWDVWRFVPELYRAVKGEDMPL
jgi:SIR2-like domain